MPLSDGVGHLTITMTYDSLSREEHFTQGRAVRVHPGPIFPKRTILRGRVQGDLDRMLDRIEQCETEDNE